MTRDEKIIKLNEFKARLDKIYHPTGHNVEMQDIPEGDFELTSIIFTICDFGVPRFDINYYEEEG